MWEWFIGLKYINHIVQYYQWFIIVNMSHKVILVCLRCGNEDFILCIIMRYVNTSINVINYSKFQIHKVKYLLYLLSYGIADICILLIAVLTVYYFNLQLFLSLPYFLLPQLCHLYLETITKILIQFSVCIMYHCVFVSHWNFQQSA